MSTKITPHSPLDGPAPDLVIPLHDGSEEPVSIIIVHKDRPEYLNILVQSIAVTSVNNNYEIIVVDNASEHESQEFLDALEKEGIRVVRNEKNLYWSAAANKGAAHANRNSKYLIFMHCDVVVENPGWMDLLINVSESQGSGMVGVEMGSYSLDNKLVQFIQEWCVLMTRECWVDCSKALATQGWPEDLPQIGPAFVMTAAAKNEGHKPQVMKNKVCHHYRIFSLDINDYDKLVDSAMVTIPKVMRRIGPLA